MAENYEVVLRADDIVPALAFDSSCGRPGADGEKLVAPRARQALLRADAGVDEEEVGVVDVQGDGSKPWQQLGAGRSQAGEGSALIRPAEAGVPSGLLRLQLLQQTGVVISQDHLRPGFTDESPHMQGVGASAEGVAGEQQSVGLTLKSDLLQQLAQLPGAPVYVPDDDSAHEMIHASVRRRSADLL